MPFRLQGIDRPNQATVCVGGRRQYPQGLLTRTTQQSPELAIQFPHRALIDQDAVRRQTTLNLNKLPVLFVMLPTKVSHDIQPIRTVR
jgi:hypothetical protein